MSFRVITAQAGLARTFEWIPSLRGLPTQAGIFLARSCQALGILHCVHEYLFDIRTSVGGSMEPHFAATGHVLLYDRCSRWPNLENLLPWRNPTPTKEMLVDATADPPDYNLGTVLVSQEEESTTRSTIKSTTRSNSINGSGRSRRIGGSRGFAFRNSSRCSLNPYVARGDVVIFSSPEHGLAVCKRVLALPGDSVRRSPSETFQLPPGYVWVQGDNLPLSHDSRSYGPLPIALIDGRVLGKLWPPPMLERWIRARSGGTTTSH